MEETGATYAENAALKAVAASTATGLPALGDDSGLEVEALGGEPGLHSRRLGPTQAARNAELWRRLAAVPRPWRARFVAVLALARPAAVPVDYFEGRVEGELLVRVGPYRRGIVLPDSLKRREVGEARMVGDRLEVTFVDGGPA